MNPRVPIMAVALVVSLIWNDSCRAHKSKKSHHNYDPSEEKDIPVKIKLLGDLATPHPDSDIDLGFVPKQVYFQVRRYDTEKRLPQSEALKEASTPEEIVNAPRLREVLTHKKTQEVYEEQGYEDAGYDHGGSVRQKQEHEKIMEDGITKFGDNDSPTDENDADTVPEDGEHFPQEGEGRGYNVDELSPMYSDNRQRKVKPNDHNINNRVSNKNTKRKFRNERNDKHSGGHKNPIHSYRSREKKVKKYDDSRKGSIEKENNNYEGDIIPKNNKFRSYSKKKKNVENFNGERENKGKNKSKIRGDKKQLHRNHKYTTKDLEETAEKRMDKLGAKQKSEKNQNIYFDAEKFPFYNKLKSNKFTKNSALRYAMNPKEIPLKVPNKMSFYESRTHHCDEVTGPKVDVPNGEEKNSDSSEMKNPNRGKPRMGKLGETIDCLKRKFFGHEPLDNPFFKENFD